MGGAAVLVGDVNKVYCRGISQSNLRQRAVNISLCSVLFFVTASRVLDITTRRTMIMTIGGCVRKFVVSMY